MSQIVTKQGRFHITKYLVVIGILLFYAIQLSES